MDKTDFYSLKTLLRSLTDTEKDFISAADYGQEADKHREQLDLLLERDGVAALPGQSWYPYEVIELCKNCLHEGHEREFVACMGIVLHNIIVGNDATNDYDFLRERFDEYKGQLSPDALVLLETLFDEVLNREIEND